MKKLFNSIWKNEFYKGGIVLTASSFVVNIFNYFFNFIVGRSLGPSGYGEISTLFSYITILSIPTAIISTLIIQKIGSAEGEKSLYARSLELFINHKLKKYAPLLLIAFIIIPFIPRITNLSPLASYVLIPLIILSILTSIYNSLLQGLKLFFLISVVSLLITGFKLLGAVLTLFSVGQTEIIILFLVISSFLGYIASIYALRSHTDLKKENQQENKIEKRLMSIFTSHQFIITALSVGAIIALNNIDIIFVKKFFPAEEAGLYSSWALFAKAIFYILGPILGVSFIFFAHNKDKNDQKKSFKFSLAGLIILGILSYFTYTFFASSIISLLFGPKFNAIIPYLGLASIYGSLYALIMFINNYFMANKSRVALILPITLPLYIIGLFLIPKDISVLFILNNIYAFVIVVSYLTAFFMARE